jgi:hypothetical protein
MCLFVVHREHNIGWHRSAMKQHRNIRVRFEVEMNACRSLSMDNIVLVDHRSMFSHRCVLSIGPYDYRENRVYVHHRQDMYLLDNERYRAWQSTETITRFVTFDIDPCRCCSMRIGRCCDRFRVLIRRTRDTRRYAIVRTHRSRLANTLSMWIDEQRLTRW